MIGLHSYLRLSVACVLLCVTEVSATTYYVRSSGDDDRSGTSSWSAFRTIKKAASVAKNGDVVEVGSGTYSDAFDILNMQDSTAMLEFRAEYSANAVISGQVRVINSNNIVFKRFRFEGATVRPMIWSGSYDGTLDGCEFSGGAEAILVQDGSLTLDRCDLSNFIHDGLQVDGEALVHLTQSTISGCQGDGIAIRKVARVVLDETTVRDNLGDGIRLAITTDSIEEIAPPSGSGGSSDRLLLTKGGFNVESDSYVSGDVYTNSDVTLSNSSDIYGDVYHGAGSSVNRPWDVSGTIGEIDPPAEFHPIDPGDAATSNDNSQVPSSYLDSGGVFMLEWGSLTLPGGTYYFKDFSLKGSSELKFSGKAVIYVEQDVMITESARVNWSYGDTHENVEMYVMGSTVTVKESSRFRGGIYAPNALIEILTNGQFEGLAIGDIVLVKDGSQLRSNSSLSSMAGKVLGSTPSSPNLPADWSPITSGELVITSSILTGNSTAVNVLDQHSFETSNTDISSNREWGLQLRGTSRVENCTINNNATGGVWLNNVATTDLTFSSNTIEGNTEYGLYAETCDLTFDSTNIAGWAISGSNKLFAASDGSLTLDGITVSGGTTAGVHASNNTLTVRNATFRTNGYGIAAQNCSVLVENSTLSQNSVGLYSNQNTVVVRNGSLHSNSLWGAAVYADTVTPTTATFENTAIHSNLGGLTLVNGSNGDLLLRQGTEIRDNSDAGLHFENCDLTINDQSGGANWRTLRNGYGIRCHLATLNLVDVLIEESSIYGVRCEGSDVTLTDCTVSGKSGIYADAANTSLTVKACKLEEAAGTSGGWGLVRSGGNLTVSDSLFAGFDNGVYLNTAGSFDQANVLNATIANVSAYGVYLAAGDATVQNTIVHGNGASHGLSRAGGQLIHSHNLIDGFSTPFDGTSANDTEILKQPHFVDAVVGDFHLGKGSPAINAGADVGIFSPTDLEGNSRPSFNVFDIGAYEYMSPSGSFRVMEWRETQ